MNTDRPTFAQTLRQTRFWLITAAVMLVLAPAMAGGALIPAGCAGYLACRQPDLRAMNASVWFWAVMAALTTAFTPGEGLVSAAIASLLITAVIWDGLPQHRPAATHAA